MLPPSNDHDLLIKLHSAIEAYYQTAEHFFSRQFARPTIKLNLRGYSAGTATPQLNLLRFNRELLLNNQQHFLQHTVPHEIAHLLAYQIFGLKIRPHGQEWQQIMTEVYKIPAERCHRYHVEKKPTTYYIYGCDCPITHPLTIRRHNAITKGKQYICKYCKTKLYYKEMTKSL